MTNQSEPSIQQHIDNLLDDAYACLYSNTPRSFDLAQDALKLASTHAYSTGEARSLRQMASCYMVRSAPAEAMPYAITGLTLALENDLKREGAYAYLLMGTLQNMAGNDSLAAEIFVDGLELARLCDDPTLMVLLHHNLAGVYHNFNDYDWQIFHLEQALKFVDQADDPSHYRAQALAALGSAYLGKEDYQETLQPLPLVLDYAEEHQIWHLQANALDMLGHAYLGLEEYDRAEAALRRALALATDHHLPHWIITAWTHLADLHAARSEPDQVLECLQTGLGIAQEYAHHEQEKEIHKRLAAAYEHIGKYHHALDHYRAYHTLHDQAYQQDTQTRIRVLKTKFDLEQARREVEFQRMRQEDQRRQEREHERAESERLERERLRLILEETQKHEVLIECILERVAHKFRTPLTAINNSANLLARYHDRLTEDKRTYHQQTINESVTRLNTMLGDLLTVLRRDHGPMTAESQTLALATVCQEAIRAAEEAAKTGNRVHPSLNTTTAASYTAPQRLCDIITHLLTNALTFSTGDVDLAITHQDDQLIITVTDSGIGIPSDEHERVFEPFYRASNLAPHLLSSGLGLTIVHHDVTQLGGRIDLNSAPGEGTTVTVVLPLARPGDRLK